MLVNVDQGRYAVDCLRSLIVALIAKKRKDYCNLFVKIS